MVPDTGFLSRRRCSFNSVTFISSITAKYSDEEEEEKTRMLLLLLLVRPKVVVVPAGRRSARRAAAAVEAAAEEGRRAAKKAEAEGRPRHRHKDDSVIRRTILRTGIFSQRCRGRRCVVIFVWGCGVDVAK